MDFLLLFISYYGYSNDSLCIPHVDSRFSAEIISDTFKTIIHLQNPSPQIGLCAWGGTAPP